MKKKVKVFNTSTGVFLESKINDFLDEINPEIFDIKYTKCCEEMLSKM